ncbi:MAG: DUF2007 domain-containing protein [Tenuifilaceae bacterium]|jgi:hypothetical protein|nr:DUF2007 domain-containing protein [Tenuifilaceae bacterium]
MDDQSWIPVFSTTIPFQAEIIKQMLNSNGVEAVVLNKQDSSYPTIGEAQVLVQSGDESTAKKLIEEIEF